MVHPYGMSLLFGNCSNLSFNKRFRDYSLNLNTTRADHEWMQAFPGTWDTVLSELYGGNMVKSSENTENKQSGIIELNTRVNFKFNREKYSATSKKPLPEDSEIVRAGKQIFNEMKGAVVPSHFWDDADDFFRKGIAFSLYCDNKLASTAFSAFVLGDKLEIGIETVEEFRGKGFAQHICTALIDYCLENNYEPIWACRLENKGSYNLALKLGFEPSAQLPYYKLSK